MTGIVKTIQRGTVTIAAGSTSGTATITSVNTANALLLHNGMTEGNGQNCSTVMSRITLTNGTTITATRNTSDASFACTVNFSIIEFVTSAIKSMQYGTIAVSSAQTSNTATITSVTTTNAAVFWLGSISDQGGANPGGFLSAVDLTNATTVTAHLGTATANNTVGYVVCEFNAGILHSNTQQTTISVTTPASNTATITSVTANNSILAYGGFTINGNVGGSNQAYMQLTNGTTITATRNNTGATVTKAYVTVIEFPSGALNSAVQRGSVAMSSSTTSGTTTITSVTTANSSINCTGWYSDQNATMNNDNFPTVALTNATTVTIARAVSIANVVTAGFEVAEWIIFVAPTSGMFLVF